MPTSATRPPAAASSGSACSSSTSSGDRPTSASPWRSRRSRRSSWRRPLRPRRAGAPDLVGPAGRGSFAMPSLHEWRDSAIVGALLLGGGMGMVAWGEQTIPSGIAALIIALMPVGRDLRSPVLRRAPARDRDRRHRRRLRRRGDPGRPDDRRRDGRPRSARSRGAAHLADLVDGGLSMPAIAPRSPVSRSLRRGSRWCAGRASCP